MIRLCTNCIFYRAPKTAQPFQLTAGRSAGEIKAEREWMDESQKRRAEEQRRVEDGYQFNYEPEFFAWCAEKTPAPDQVARLQERLLAGDESALREAQSQGLKFTINPAMGSVDPMYELCSRKNAQGNCPSHQLQKAGAGS